MPDDPTRLGTVEDVRGGTVGVALHESTVSGLVFIDGHGYRIGQVGSFVRIPLGYVDLFGVVSTVGAGAVPERLAEAEPYGRRWMTAELVGEAHGGGSFRRGLSQHPTIGDSVHLVTERDLARIYGTTDRPSVVAVGRVASAESIPALVDVDKLVTRHSAVLGTTGAGKSTTVASLLTSLSDPVQYPSCRILILDIHGEYGPALQDRATVFRINPDTATGDQSLYIPYWAMSFDELMPVTLGILSGPGRGAVIERMAALKRESLKNQPKAGVTEDNLTVDTPLPFSIHKLWFDMHWEMRATHYEITGEPKSPEAWALEMNDKDEPVQPGDPMKVIPPRFKALKNIADDPEKIRSSQSNLHLERAVDELGSRLRDPRFDFLFRPGPWSPDKNGTSKKDLDSLLRSWLGGDRPITILDLSGVPVSILTDLIGSLLRIVYESLFWARLLPEGGRLRPLLVVLEEAHAYLAKGDTGPAAQAVRRIVKEGRKYGVGAMLVSQRPAEVDDTILSQCGTLFAMRLTNSTDRGQVASAAPDNIPGLLEMLPALRTGETLILGEAVRLPLRAVVDPPAEGRWPDSKDPLIYDEEVKSGWNPKRKKERYDKVVRVWRAQDPTNMSPPSGKKG